MFRNNRRDTIPAFYPELLRQKHLLIAGATGSGKSTLINALLYTALFQPPDKIQFILLDQKGVELQNFEYLPHTIKYAVKPSDTIAALKYARKICDLRFNQMRRKRQKLYSGSDIYIIIDEFADLVTMNKKEVIPLIQSLTQIGRAAKIHVILCTQCPISKIIPTEIKVNFDSRIALKTACKQDSINIIGVTGAENLEVGCCYYKHSAALDRVFVPEIPDNKLIDMCDLWLPFWLKIK